VRVKIISGANLNVLERRGADYGGISYADLEKSIIGFACDLGLETEFFASNFEGELIEAVQNTSADALIINAGAYSHYSLAIADALRILSIPKIEVHLTNIHAKGRHESVTGAACDGMICGLGIDGYRLALQAVINYKLKRM